MEKAQIPTTMHPVGHRRPSPRLCAHTQTHHTHTNSLMSARLAFFLSKNVFFFFLQIFTGKNNKRVRLPLFFDFFEVLVISFRNSTGSFGRGKTFKEKTHTQLKRKASVCSRACVRGRAGFWECGRGGMSVRMCRLSFSFLLVFFEFFARRTRVCTMCRTRVHYHQHRTTTRVGALLPMPSCLGIGGHPSGSRQGHPRYTGAR